MASRRYRTLTRRLTDATEAQAQIIERQAQAAALLAANSAVVSVWNEIKDILERIAVKLENEPGPPGA